MAVYMELLNMGQVSESPESETSTSTSSTSTTSATKSTRHDSHEHGDVDKEIDSITNMNADNTQATPMCISKCDIGSIATETAIDGSNSNSICNESVALSEIVPDLTVTGSTSSTNNPSIGLSATSSIVNVNSASMTDDPHSTTTSLALATPLVLKTDTVVASLDCDEVTGSSKSFASINSSLTLTESHAVSSSRRCCVAAYCRGSRHLYQFPKDKFLASKWKRFVCDKIPYFVPVNHSYLCYKHFTKDCFTNYGPYLNGLAARLRLDNNAIPSIQTNLEPPKEHTISEKERRAIVRDALKVPPKIPERIVSAPPKKKPKVTPEPIKKPLPSPPPPPPSTVKETRTVGLQTRKTLARERYRSKGVQCDLISVSGNSNEENVNFI